MKSPLGLLLLLTACRFGGNDGDALALVEPERDGGRDAAADATLPMEDATSAPADMPDAAPLLDAAPLPDASVDAAPSQPEAGADAGDDSSCNPSPPRGCDLVHNTGCTAGVTQCIVDPESLEQAGRCVFTGLALTPCSESTLSTSCPAQHACVAGLCRKYCYCDADCEPGSQCSEPLGDAATSVVMLCASPRP